MKTYTIELVENANWDRYLRVYKKINVDGKRAIAVLQVPMAMGTFIHMSNSKCRTTEAFVERIESVKKNKKGKYTQYLEGTSQFDWAFRYCVGKYVKPRKKFSHNRDDCASGIHFFFTRKEAEKYNV